MSGPGDFVISVDCLREDVQLLKVRITLQKGVRDVGLADAAL